MKYTRRHSALLPKHYFPMDDIARGTWYVIHLAAAHEDAILLSRLISLLLSTFKCPKCRDHLKDFLQTHPIPTNTKRLFEWTSALHNEVNRRQKKRELTEFEKKKVKEELLTRTEGSGHCPYCPLKESE